MSTGYFMYKIRTVTLLLVTIASLFFTLSGRAAIICAQVKLEIRQEAVLERQAFDAMMRINNGLEDFPLTDVAIRVLFQDGDGNPVEASSDPNNRTAAFFIRTDSLDKIEAIDGTGVVLPGTSAEIHWLIIPAPGASADQGNGQLYFVGATLDYRLGGESQTVEVAPDFILVRPLPKLVLDYFLPDQVIADDPFTPETEASQPFTLGVRINNTGEAEVRNFTMDSAQPRIVENDQGLLIDFEILSSSVDDFPLAPGLLLDLGDIAPHSAVMGRWQMQTTLAGNFIEFSASFSHEDSLGGSLTSLIDAIYTHTLLRNVRVDRPDRDNRLDFLAQDGDVVRVYESEGLDTEVVIHTAQATLGAPTQDGGQFLYPLNSASTDGLSWLQVSDPQAGRLAILEVIRSDGKRLPPENSWISQERETVSSWKYLINLFDSGSTGQYQLVMAPPPQENRPPVIALIQDKSRYAGQALEFLVQASDPDGDSVQLFLENLPDGATFTDPAEGPGVFSWTAQPNQIGIWPLTVRASDGQLESTRSLEITVLPGVDSDGDGMADHWEQLYFGHLGRDGTGDLDADGITDLQEYLDQSNPAVSGSIAAPHVFAPPPGSRVDSQPVRLEIDSVIHAPELTVSYQFALYQEESLQSLLEQADEVAETPIITAWEPSVLLTENQHYVWRVRAHDGTLYSPWVLSHFQLNQENEPPTAPTLSFPAPDSDVDTFTPRLKASSSQDPDGDVLEYSMAVYSDPQGQEEVALSDRLYPVNGLIAWQPDAALEENRSYYWQTWAEDPAGLRQSFPLTRFRVNTVNEAPSVPALISPARDTEVSELPVQLVAGNSTDPEQNPLDYFFALDSEASFDSPDAQQSAPLAAGVSGQATWQPPLSLEENRRYFWRVKASDGQIESDWQNGNFFVNAVNDPPATPQISNPGEGSWTDSLQPLLQVQPASDPDDDLLRYHFALYSDFSGEILLIEGDTAALSWKVPVMLEDNQWYAWQVQTLDPHGEKSAWSTLHHFLTDSNGVDDSPILEWLEPAEKVSGSDQVMLRWTDVDPDSNAEIDLFYSRKRDFSDPRVIVAALPEDPDVSGDEYLWDTTFLPAGNYFVGALIHDDQSESFSVAPGKVQRRVADSPVVLAGENRAKTGEDGSSTQVQVSLGSAPTANVVVGLWSTDTTEGVLDTDRLTFTPANWDSPQSVTVTGVNDCALDGKQVYRIRVSGLVSEDPAYNGASRSKFRLRNLDNDISVSHPAIRSCGVWLVNTVKEGKYTYYTLEAAFINTGSTAFSGGRAILSSRQKKLEFLDAEIQLPPLAPGAQQRLTDTVTLRWKKAKDPKINKLSWQIEE